MAKFPWEQEAPAPPDPDAEPEEKQSDLPPTGTVAYLADGQPVLVLGPHEETRLGGTDKEPVELEQVQVALLPVTVVEKTQLHAEPPVAEEATA